MIITIIILCLCLIWGITILYSTFRSPNSNRQSPLFLALSPEALSPTAKLDTRTLPDDENGSGRECATSRPITLESDLYLLCFAIHRWFTFKTVCAWCKPQRRLTGWPWAAITSHSICKECAAIEQAKVRTSQIGPIGPIGPIPSRL